jgi:dolichol-phosphate mannosyltransferase
MNSKITTAIIIPSYNETLALPELLRELKIGLSENDAVIVMDDSPHEISKSIKIKCLDSIKNTSFEFRFDNSGNKSGRGAAIRRGMIVSLSEYPNIENVLECDADGSHRARDILKIKNFLGNPDLLVGSRYLASSEIIGWPASRRVFSWTLNQIIPRFTGVKLRDITNGLRRYSKEAVEKILAEPQINSGFIYLSEQAILVTKARMVIFEEPIIFVDRTLGSSTVTWREVVNSLYGILKLVLTNHKV